MEVSNRKVYHYLEHNINCYSCKIIDKNFFHPSIFSTLMKLVKKYLFIMFYTVVGYNSITALP